MNVGAARAQGKKRRTRKKRHLEPVAALPRPTIPPPAPALEDSQSYNYFPKIPASRAPAVRAPSSSEPPPASYPPPPESARVRRAATSYEAASPPSAGNPSPPSHRPPPPSHRPPPPSHRPPPPPMRARQESTPSSIAQTLPRSEAPPDEDDIPTRVRTAPPSAYPPPRPFPFDPPTKMPVDGRGERGVGAPISRPASSPSHTAPSPHVSTQSQQTDFRGARQTQTTTASNRSASSATASKRPRRWLRDRKSVV